MNIFKIPAVIKPETIIKSSASENDEVENIFVDLLIVFSLSQTCIETVVNLIFLKSKLTCDFKRISVQQLRIFFEETSILDFLVLVPEESRDPRA